MNRRGMSLVEILVGIALFAIVSYGFFSFQKQTFKMVRVVSDNAALARALEAIERDVSSDVPFLPPQEPVLADDDNDRASKIFLDDEKTGTRCYDKTGARVATCDDYDTEAATYFRLKFYKARVTDTSMDAASPMARMPLSRVRFQLEFKVDKKKQEPMYFSRLYTDTLRY